MRPKQLRQDLPEPASDQIITQIHQARGGGLYTSDIGVLRLDSKFTNRVFLRNKGYVIAEFNTEPVKNSDKENASADAAKPGAVVGTIVHVLYAPDIKNLKKLGLWPAELEQPNLCNMSDESITSHQDDHSVESGSDSDSLPVFKNTNRRH